MTGRPQGVAASTFRPRLMFEVASEMVGAPDWPFRSARLSMRDQGAAEADVFSMTATQDPAVIDEVERGEVHASMLNPSAMLTLAVRGTGPFDRPRAISAIAIIPSYDQLVFAVNQSTGLTSLDQIAEQRYPLRVSIRGSHDPSTALLAEVVLQAHGFGLADLASWGGEVFYDQPLPNHPSRMGRAESGEIDAVFDEAVNVWASRAAQTGMQFLALDDAHLNKLETMGFRRGVLEKALHPGLPEDVPTVDFSGWPIYTSATAPERFVRAFCTAMQSRRDRIPWESTGEQALPLELMCKDSVGTPLDVPLHPTAEQFWREQGYIS